MADPGWDHNTEAGRNALRQCRDGLLESLARAGQKTTNWSKVRECQQGSTEHPSDFYARLATPIRMYGGVNPENRSLLVSLFVDQSTPNICKYFSKHAPGWQGKEIDEIVSIATFVFDGRDDKQEKLRKKQQEEKLPYWPQQPRTLFP